MPRVFIPPSMRDLTENEAVIEVGGENLRQVIECLDGRYPGLKSRLCQNDTIKPGISVAVSGSVATLGLYQKTAADAEIHFLPAIGGG